MKPTRQRPRIERSLARAEVTFRAPRVSRTALARTAIPTRVHAVPRPVPVATADFQIDPYVDYSRSLTPEGGILIVFKNIDTRFRYKLRRLVLWAGATGGEAWYLFHYPFVHAWLWIVCLIPMAYLNWLIVKRQVEIYSRIEIRHDCMILDGSDIFWSRYMEKGWPSFRQDPEGQVLSGIYGTRHVDYLTVRRIDPNDQFGRSGDILAAHLQGAMQQLWVPHR